jgi:hypothetical protein
MLKALEGMEPREAEAVLASVTRSLLPTASLVPPALEGASNTPEQQRLSEQVLDEIKQRIPGVEQLPEHEVRSALLQLLYEELSEYLLPRLDYDSIRWSAWQAPLDTRSRRTWPKIDATSKPKPTIFVGSSREGLALVRSFQDLLSDVAVVMTWLEATLVPGITVLDQLLRSANRFDFAVFILTSDDAAGLRGRPRGHVPSLLYFEAGLLVGKLGVDRVSFIVPSGEARLASDLAGISTLTYDPSGTRGGIEESARLLMKQIKRLGPLGDVRFSYSA